MWTTSMGNHRAVRVSQNVGVLIVLVLIVPWWSHIAPVSEWLINTLGLRQDARHLADDIFKRIFLNQNVWILIKISLKFILNGPINNIPALVQIMAWYRPGDKPLYEPMMVSLLMHICVTRPQWVKVEHPLSDSGQWRSNSPYKPCNHSLYFGIIIIPHTDNTQSTGHN